MLISIILIIIYFFFIILVAKWNKNQKTKSKPTKSILVYIKIVAMYRTELDCKHIQCKYIHIIYTNMHIPWIFFLSLFFLVLFSLFQPPPRNVCLKQDFVMKECHYNYWGLTLRFILGMEGSVSPWYDIQHVQNDGVCPQTTTL